MKQLILLILVVVVACLYDQKRQSDLSMVQTDTLAPTTGNAYRHVPIPLGEVLSSKEGSLPGDSVDLKNHLETVDFHGQDIEIK